MGSFFESISSFFEILFNLLTGFYDNIITAFGLITRASGFLANFPNYVPSFLQISVVIFIVISFINWWLSKQ